VLEVRRLRLAREWNQTELAYHAGLAPSVISQIENGKRNPTARTLRKLAKALEVEVSDLFPKEQAPLPNLDADGALEERRAAWDAAVHEARQLRETGWSQMWKALSEWRASKKRGEPYTTRRTYLDKMGGLLQEAYDADGAVGWAYIEAALSQGGSDARLPSYLREESRIASHFYGELLGLVKSVGLSVRTNGKQAAEQAAEEAGVRTESEKRPTRVEESDAA
jgi:transcriptional regulator with XRE-family HTH domain